MVLFMVVLLSHVLGGGGVLMNKRAESGFGGVSIDMPVLTSSARDAVSPFHFSRLICAAVLGYFRHRQVHTRSLVGPILTCIDEEQRSTTVEIW